MEWVILVMHHVFQVLSKLKIFILVLPQVTFTLMCTVGWWSGRSMGVHAGWNWRLSRARLRTARDLGERWWMLICWDSLCLSLPPPNPLVFMFSWKISIAHKIFASWKWTMWNRCMLTEGEKWNMPELRAAENILQKVPSKKI